MNRYAGRVFLLESAAIREVDVLMTWSRVRRVAVACVWLLTAVSPSWAQQPATGGAPAGGAPAPLGPQAAPPAGIGQERGEQGATEGRGGRAGGPTEPARPPGTFALQTAGRVVPNLDKSLEFYRRVFALLPYGRVPQRPLMNQAMEKLNNLPGMRMRQATLRLPNSGLLMRLVEVSNIEAAAKAPQAMSDPGTAIFRFEVTDVESVVANLERAGARFVSPASAQAARTASPILVRDPDGYLLEIAKGLGAQGTDIGAGASPILDSRMVLTSASMDAKLKFYRDILGAPVPAASDWGKAAFGTGEVRSSRSDDIGGPGRVLEFREFRNAGQAAPFQPRPQDPGATLLSFFVRDLPAVTKQIQDDGTLTIVTPEGKPVRLANLDRLVVKDPDGVFVELIQE